MTTRRPCGSRRYRWLTSTWPPTRTCWRSQRRRDEPGHAQRLREALLEAADPIVAIVETAAELATLAADAAAQARGGVRGEAVTAVTLAAAVAQAGAPLVELNLGGARDDPRLDQVRRAAQRAREACDRSRARA